MSGTLEVTGDDSKGVPVITLKYDANQMLESGSDIASKLSASYEELAKKLNNSSVVVNIDATIAGSPVIRALIKIHQAARAQKGRLVCVGYPQDYLPGLTSLGLLSNSDFMVADNLESAIKQLKPKVS